MTVVEVAEDEIVCMWTSEEGALFREAIPAVALKAAKLDDDDDDDDDDD